MTKRKCSLLTAITIGLISASSVAASATEATAAVSIPMERGVREPVTLASASNCSYVLGHRRCNQRTRRRTRPTRRRCTLYGKCR